MIKPDNIVDKHRTALCSRFCGPILHRVLQASWHIHNHVAEKPLFAGKATIAMAREVYGIADPEDGQMRLF